LREEREVALCAVTPYHQPHHFTCLSLARQRIAVAGAVKILPGDNGEKMVRNQTLKVGNGGIGKISLSFHAASHSSTIAGQAASAEPLSACFPRNPMLRRFSRPADNAESSSSTVSVIDTTMGAVIATIPVGLVPDGVAVSPDGGRVYINPPLRTPYRLLTRTV
jgi:YVTN family beta-propeller protein